VDSSEIELGMIAVQFGQGYRKTFHFQWSAEKIQMMMID
jgi:hypothetical protein